MRNIQFSGREIEVMKLLLEHTFLTEDELLKKIYPSTTGDEIVKSPRQLLRITIRYLRQYFPVKFKTIDKKRIYFL